MANFSAPLYFKTSPEIIRLAVMLYVRYPPFTSVIPRLREESEQPKRTEALSGKAVLGQAWRNLVSGAEH